MTVVPEVLIRVLVQGISGLLGVVPAVVPLLRVTLVPRMTGLTTVVLVVRLSQAAVRAVTAARGRRVFHKAVKGLFLVVAAEVAVRTPLTSSGMLAVTGVLGRLFSTTPARPLHTM
jgi:VIT1/CCC1 family predicted Fe2+/Mn2+ transporter